jgi:hypothetical protein
MGCSASGAPVTKTPSQLERDIALTVGPGPRPKDPREISFAPHCFVEVGRRTEFVVSPHPGSTSYPARFTSRAEAEALAKKTGRRIHEEDVAVRKRICWK